MTDAFVFFSDNIHSVSYILSLSSTKTSKYNIL